MFCFMSRAFILAKHCLFLLSIMSQDEVNIVTAVQKWAGPKTYTYYIHTTISRKANHFSHCQILVERF